MAGFATFNQCNKAGSIPLFTATLQTKPYDYESLMWRGRAYGILDEKEKATADYKMAYMHSSGVNKDLAEFHYELSKGNIQKAFELVDNTTKKYPDSGAALSEKGELYYAFRRLDEALSLLSKSVDLGKQHKETNAPWFPWCCVHAGDINFEKQEVFQAIPFYNQAVDSSDSLTVGHIGLCKCYILCLENKQLAQEQFIKAKELNASLLSSENFDDFCEETLLFDAQRSLKKTVSRTTEKSETCEKKSSTKGRGQAAGGGGSGSGNGSDSSGGDDDDENVWWTKLQEESPCIKKQSRGNRKYVQSKCGKYWYSRDTAGHGGAFVKGTKNGSSAREHKNGSFAKIYKNTGSSLKFIGSVDKKGHMITSKHESREGTSISKSDLNTIYSNPKNR